MRKLNKQEKKIINYLNDEVSEGESKSEVLTILRNHLGFSVEEATKFYRLWYYAMFEDLDQYIVPEESALYELVDTLSIMNSTDIDDLIGDLYDNKKEYLNRIFGTYLSSDCGGRYSKTPCASFDGDGLTIELDSDEWEKYFSGLDTEYAWLYYVAYSSYSDWYEEVYDSEFDYVYYNGETIENLEKIAVLAGKNDWPGKDNSGINPEEINNFLKETLPPKLYDDIVNEYLSEMSMELTKAKTDAIRTEYDENVKYNTNETRCQTGDYCIHIPYNDLLEIIKDKDIINLSDLRDVGVNPDIDLYDTLSDTWLDEDGVEEVIKTLNNSLESVIEEISENVDLNELLEERRKVQEMLETLDLKLISTTKNKGSMYKSNDGRIELFTNDINYVTKKIKFTYDGKSHMVPYDTFSNWVQGSILDLNENIKKRKRVLKEEKENIHKISIFDFDGTLMNTPSPSEGKSEWESKTNKTYPHIGWWSKPESLDTTIFNITPISSTIESYENEKDNPETLIIMLTGRIPNLSNQIEEILTTNKVYFDEYHYKGDGDTLSSKINTIKSLLNRYPNVELIEMWEDRVNHAKEFELWGKNNNVNIKINRVSFGNDIKSYNINENINRTQKFINKVSEILNPPYFKNLELYVAPEELWNDIFSIIFNKEVSTGYNKIFDNNNNVIYYEDSNGYWLKQEYDNNGNKLYHEDSTGYWSKYEYDNNNNRIYYEDSSGYWEKYEYDNNNNEIYYENSNGYKYP